MKQNKKIKNRGAISNPCGRFEKTTHEVFHDGWDNVAHEEEELPTLETSLLIERAKTIITRNNSPDISFEQSINPYRGCEHGCIYCYARPSHGYMNLSAGIDFETKIFYKHDAAALFEKEISRANYECKTIVLGANTDPYQPAESKLKVTRSLLEVACRYKHPIAIITKSSLIERDMDLITQLAKNQLVKVAVSVTTLSMPLKRILEPRTSSPLARLAVLKKLNAEGVPTTVMAAPMIPMINDMELESILEAASEIGTKHAGYTFIRLPYEVKELFKEWLAKHFPDRKDHVMSLIMQMRHGKEYDATFGKRMKGDGKFAELLALRFKLACKKFGINQSPSCVLDVTKLNKKVNDKQLCLEL